MPHAARNNKKRKHEHSHWGHDQFRKMVRLGNSYKTEKVSQKRKRYCEDEHNSERYTQIRKKSRQNFHRNKIQLKRTDTQMNHQSSYILIKNRRFHKGESVKFNDRKRITRGQVLQTNAHGLVYVQEIDSQPNQVKSNRIHLILAESLILEQTQLNRSIVIGQQRTLFDTLSKRDKEKNKFNELYQVPLADSPTFTNRILTEQLRKKHLNLFRKFDKKNIQCWPRMLHFIFKIHEKERARETDDIRGIFDKSVFCKHSNSHPDYSLIYAIIYVGPDTYSLSKKNKTHDQTKLIYIGQTHQYLIERFVNHVTTAMAWSNDNMRNYHLYRAMNKLGIHNFIILPLEKIMASRTTNKGDMSKLTTERENAWMFKTNSIFTKGLNAHYEAKRHTSKRRGTAKRTPAIKPISYQTWQLSIANYFKPKRLFISHTSTSCVSSRKKIILKSF